jgi:ATP-dependent Lon protease
MDDLREKKRRAILHPEDPEALAALAEALLSAGDVAEARRQAEKALQAHPAHAALLRLGVACCRHEGRVTRARELAQAAVAAAPDDAGFRDALAELLDEEGRPDDALVERLQADARQPGDERRALELAAGFARRGLALRALHALAPLLARPDAQPDAQRLAGQLRERHPGLGQTLEDRAEAALAAGPDATGPLGDALRRARAGDAAGARRALALASPPARASPAYALLRASLLREAGREAEAALTLMRAGIADAEVGALVPAHAAVGQLGALGWTPFGGAVSPVQAVAVPGEGRLAFSGNVSAAGREAGEVAWTCLRALAGAVGLGDAARGKDLHLHFVDTESAKDGPSAGLALWLAGASAVSARPLRGRLVATGELTLQGLVRKVGGLHEKCTAAWLAGATLLLAPRHNRPEIEQLPATVRGALEVTYVESAGEALAAALAPAAEER